MDFRFEKVASTKKKSLSAASALRFTFHRLSPCFTQTLVSIAAHAVHFTWFSLKQLTHRLRNALIRSADKPRYIRVNAAHHGINTCCACCHLPARPSPLHHSLFFNVKLVFTKSAAS